VKRIILADIAKVLEADMELQPHIAFPRVSWNWRLEMKIYPRTPEEKVVEATGEAVQVVADTAIPVVSEGAPHTRVVYPSQTQEVIAPDQARQEHDMPVTEVRSAMAPFMGRSAANLPTEGPTIEVGKAAKNPLTMPRQGRSEG
jgi:hypothetical protein